MSEETKEKVEDEKFEIPVPTVSNEDLEFNKKRLEEAEQALTPPEGQKCIGTRAFCSIHGDITQAAQLHKYIRYFKTEDGKMVAIPFSDIICKACISEWYRKKVDSGEFGKTVAAPIFVELTEEDKAKIAEAEAAKAKEKAPAETTEAESKA